MSILCHAPVRLSSDVSTPAHLLKSMPYYAHSGSTNQLSLENLVSTAQCAVRKQVVDSTKLTIVLDLDETLLHSYFPDKLTKQQHTGLLTQIAMQQQRVRSGHMTRAEQSVYEIYVGDGIKVICVLRPGVHAFLKHLMHSYNVVVWSAGGASYVAGIVNTLFDARLYPDAAPCLTLCWDSVVVLDSGCYTKPLTVVVDAIVAQHKVTLELSTVLLLDNRAENSVFQPMSLVLAVDFLPNCHSVAQGFESQDRYLSTVCLQQLSQLSTTIRNSKHLAVAFKRIARRSIQLCESQTAQLTEEAAQQKSSSNSLSVAAPETASESAAGLPTTSAPLKHGTMLRRAVAKALPAVPEQKAVVAAAAAAALPIPARHSRTAPTAAAKGQVKRVSKSAQHASRHLSVNQLILFFN